jgi:predicted transcriptional regulator
MEVHFTPDELQRLAQIAAHAGTDTEHLVKMPPLRLVEEDKKFRAAVQKGIEQADRRELIDHEQVVARIERVFKPQSDGRQQPPMTLNASVNTLLKIVPKQR